MMPRIANRICVRRRIDPITLEVIRHRLVSITNQIDANIKRTAFSPYIYEYNDFGCRTGGRGRPIGGAMHGRNAGRSLPTRSEWRCATDRDVRPRGGCTMADVRRVQPPPAVQGQHLNNTVMYTPDLCRPGTAQV